MSNDMKIEEDAPPPHRRDFLGLAIIAAALVGGAAAAAEPAACEVEDDSGRLAMRATLEYVSPSATLGKACAGCTFFTKTVETCGQCKLINGPVSAAAVCGSWAPKK
jgi:hypothetical protein